MLSTQSPVRRASLEQVVIRKDGTREDLGTVAYWHRSRTLRLVWRLEHAAGRGRLGRALGRLRVAAERHL